MAAGWDGSAPDAVQAEVPQGPHFKPGSISRIFEQHANRSKAGGSARTVRPDTSWIAPTPQSETSSSECKQQQAFLGARCIKGFTLYRFARFIVQLGARCIKGFTLNRFASFIVQLGARCIKGWIIIGLPVSEVLAGVPQLLSKPAVIHPIIIFKHNSSGRVACGPAWVNRMCLHISNHQGS